MKKHTTRSIVKLKQENKKLQMLTCYDFQTAQILNESKLDLILVGDSLGNVVLGYNSTIHVTVNDMITFGAAVKRGAPDKFVVIDLPFGSNRTIETGLEDSVEIFRLTGCEAIKIEGAHTNNLELIKRLVQIGIPVMGHIGLMPQSVHAQGGFYKHGKSDTDAKRIFNEAKTLEHAGCFSIVLECVEEKLSYEISQSLSIPTIGIGSGKDTDGQVLVINDLFGMTQHYPSFAKPMANFHQIKKEIVDIYLG